MIKITADVIFIGSMWQSPNDYNMRARRLKNKLEDLYGTERFPKMFMSGGVWRTDKLRNSGGGEG